MGITQSDRMNRKELADGNGEGIMLGKRLMFRNTCPEDSASLLRALAWKLQCAL